MASERNGTLYLGVTSNLVARAYQHRTAVVSGFASRHGCASLVYYELHADMTATIKREKQIKAGSRLKKITLIQANNPTWGELYNNILYL